MAAGSVFVATLLFIAYMATSIALLVEKNKRGGDEDLSAGDKVLLWVTPFLAPFIAGVIAYANIAAGFFVGLIYGIIAYLIFAVRHLGLDPFGK